MDVTAQYNKYSCREQKGKSTLCNEQHSLLSYLKALKRKVEKEKLIFMGFPVSGTLLQKKKKRFPWRRLGRPTKTSFSLSAGLIKKPPARPAIKGSHKCHSCVQEATALQSPI